MARKYAVILITFEYPVLAVLIGELSLHAGLPYMLARPQQKEVNTYYLTVEGYMRANVIYEYG